MAQAIELKNDLIILKPFTLADSEAHLAGESARATFLVNFSIKIFYK